MPQITYSCPDCGELLQARFEDESVQNRCPACNSERSLQPPDLHGGYLQRCIACPSTELFVRKDFPQRLGVTIVAVGFIVSSIFWYYHNVMATFGVLLLTALIDVVLYLTMGNVLECYRCHAQYRGLPGFDDYDQFDLEAYEKHRQQALRLKEAKAEKEYREAVEQARETQPEEVATGDGNPANGSSN